MTWSNFYMFCFLVGLILSLLSLLMGLLHIHLPGTHGHFHLHVHLPHGGHVHVPAAGAGMPADVGGMEVSPFNFATVMAFLAWFGGAGYLLTNGHYVGFLAVLGFSTLSGLAGASLVFLFLAKVLMRTDSSLHEADYDVIGLLGRVSSGIRAGGTGEIIYAQQGARCTCGARSEDGAPIAKGVEVVITRYERGIAYVRPWEEFANEELASGAKAPEK